MELNYIAIAVLTVVNFIIGALWYSAIFGKMWMKIHHGDTKISDAEMKEMEKGMWKLMLCEFIATTLIIFGLACLVKAIPQYSGLHVAFMVWIGFILPMTVSGVIWGNDKREWMLAKISISATYRLLTLLAAGYILSVWL